MPSWSTVPCHFLTRKQYLERKSLFSWMYQWFFFKLSPLLKSWVPFFSPTTQTWDPTTQTWDPTTQIYQKNFFALRAKLKQYFQSMWVVNGIAVHGSQIQNLLLMVTKGLTLPPSEAGWQSLCSRLSWNSEMWWNKPCHAFRTENLKCIIDFGIIWWAHPKSFSYFEHLCFFPLLNCWVPFFSPLLNCKSHYSLSTF